MNCEKAYFYVTTNFMPNYDAEFELIDNDIYRHIKTGELYKKRLLFDYGWGQEPGYVCFPEPTFNQLITIVAYTPDIIKCNPFFYLSKRLRELNYLCVKNSFGAISIIMQDHVDDLISFLETKLETNYFDDKHIRKRFRHFIFDRQRAKEFGISSGGSVGTQPFEAIFKEHDNWAIISNRVIEKVYKK